MMEFALIVMILGALALVLGPRLMRGGRGGAGRGGAGQGGVGPGGPGLGGGGLLGGARGGEMAQGTLLVTGVSPRPDAEGQQFVTISGVIKGPTVDEHVVYQRMVVDVTNWPTMGQLIPVVYSPKNPDKWSFSG